MPNYKLGSRMFAIPDDKVDAFESQFPDALLNYSAAGNIYEIPAKKRKDFLKSFPGATETAWGQEESIQETAKAQDPFAPNAQYMDMSYASNIGQPEDYHYYPSPLNEEGRAETAPMTAEERSKQEYDMLMNDLNQFNAANGQFMDTYEAYEKAARKQVNEGGIGIDTFERQYLDENSVDYREKKRQRDEINERIKGNSYFNHMRMAESEAASDMADGIAQIAMNERIDNHKLGLEYSLWQSQTNYGLRQGPGVHMPISKEALDFNAAQEDLQAAERLYRKTAEIYAAPVNDGEYILNRFVKGAGERANDLDFWTMGLSAIADDVNARQAFQKIQDKLGSVKGLADMSDAELDELLTPSEQILIRAFMDNIDAMAAREGNTSGAYKAGEGAADSAMFMAQFLLTAGIGDAATVGTAAHKRLVNYFGRTVGSMKNGLLKDVARGTVKLGVGTAESIGRALVTTPLMPHTYVNIADNLMSFKDTGELTKVTDAIITGATDALIETWSESTGDFVNKVLGVPGGITKGIAKKVMKNVDFSDWGKAMNAPMMKIMRRGGFNGFLGEMGEEFIGNGVRSIIGSIAPGSGMDAESFQKFAQLDNLLITAGSFAPMTVFGLGVSSAQFGAQKRRLDNAIRAFEDELRKGGATEDQVAFAVDDMLASTDAHMTPEKLAAKASALIRELRANDRYASNFANTASAANKLMWEIARYRTFDGVYQRQEEQQRADMQAEIMEGTGREFWTTRLSGQAGLDGAAYETNEVQYVEFEDGRIAYILGGDGVTNTVVYNDGTTGFLSNEQLNDGRADGSIVSHETLSLNDYLTQQVARVRMTKEELRMSQERNEKLAQVKAAFPLEADVKMGTEEAPVMGKVKEVRLNGAFVEAADGTMRFLTWAELGHTIGVEVNAKTDAEMDEEAINNLEILDLQRRRERQQRRAEQANQQDTEEEVVDEAENEAIENPVPMKADGSVDQDAFWNMSPERWAAWKTEQRQDGGAYAASYINNAINILANEIAANEAAFQAESDFDKKDALEQVIARQQQRMQSLQALAAQYAPAVQQTQQAQPAAEQSQEGEQEKPVVLAQRQRDELNDEYKRRLSFAKALAEKEMIFEEYLKTLSSGSLPVNVVTKANYKEAMKEAKCTEQQIKRVTDAIEQAEKNKEAVNALHVNGVVWFIADYNNSIEGARRAYVHERQHNITENHPELIQRVLALGLGKEKMAQIVKSLSGSEFYSNESEAVLADEILSFAIEYAYTYGDISVPLSRKGVPIEVINLINEISNEQREDQSLVNARRHENVRDSQPGDSEQNVGNQGEVSGGVLAPEGDGPVEDSERGTEAREEGEPGAEVAEGEQPRRGAFRVTLPEDNLSEETKEELAEKGLVMQGGVIMSDDYAQLKEETGYTTPIEDEVRFSVVTKDAHISNYLQHPDAEARVVAALERLAERMTMNELVNEVISHGKHKYGKKESGSVAGPLRSNISYIITFDLDTTCPRTFQYLNYVKKIEKRIGRPLTQVESIQLAEMMRMYGQQIPCVYCYSENKRQALKQYYADFMEARHAVISANTDEEAMPFMYGRKKDEDGNPVYNPDGSIILTEAAKKVFATWRENRKGLYNPTLKMLWSHYASSRNSVITMLEEMLDSGAISVEMSDEVISKKVAKALGINSDKAVKVIEEIAGEWKWNTIEGKEHDDYTPVDEDDVWVNENAFDVWRDMTSYAKSASSAKGVIRYTPYTDELKSISKEVRDYINGMGGVRMHSSNDFRIDYVFDYFQFMADMALYKMFGHTYTKSPEFVRIFGNSGYKINMSIAAYQDQDGNIRPNVDEGFDWREAQELRELFPNAGTMLMATSDEQLQMALDSDWIDMCIPFHRSGLPKAVWYNMRLWTDYESKQNELFLNSKEQKAALKDAGVEIPKKASKEQIEELYNKHFNVEVLIGTEGKNKGKRVKPHFLPGPTIVDGVDIPGHNNDHQLYLDLCKKYGVKPRFKGIMVRDNTPEGKGKLVDITEHPRYMIFIKETARTDSPQTAVQFNFDQPSEALGGKTPMDYAFDELEARAMAEAEIAGGKVSDIYASLNQDSFGIVDQFIDTIIRHKNETGEDYPLDYITPESREWFMVQRKALEEAFKDITEIPYHRNEYDEQGNLTKGKGLENEGPIDIIEEAKKANAKHEAKAKKESGVRFSVTTEMDEAYMDAVNSGDMETAQRMVVEAARLAMPNTKVVDENGNPLVVYHGTSERFTEFSYNKIGQLDPGYFGRGFYFTPDKSMSEGYAKASGGDVVMGVFLDITNPMETDMNNTNLFGDRLEGYDGAIIRLGEPEIVIGETDYNPSEIIEIVAKYPNQIKSADAITYDDNGNVIPLSERFNPEKSDIRFRFAPRTEEQREQLFDAAKAKYGVTSNFNAAGYMLPDGSLLDFSEANDGGDPNSRSLDHRDIEGVIMDEGVEYDSRWMYIADFMNEGAIRLLPESAGINMIQAPTDEQRKKIFDFIYKYNGEVILEINDERLNSIAYMEYDRRTSPSRIFRDIDGYFKDGIVPQQDMRFRVRGAEESAMDFYQSELTAYLAKYNELAPISIADIYSRESIEDACGKRVGKLAHRRMIRLFESGRMKAVHFNNGRIVIFADDSVKDGKAVELQAFHETLHEIGLEDVGKYMWDNPGEKTLMAKYKDAIKEAYRKSDHYSEMAAYVISDYMSNGKMPQLLDKLDDASRTAVENALNTIGYDTERETGLRSAKSGRQSGTTDVVRNAADRRDSEGERRERPRVTWSKPIRETGYDRRSEESSRQAERSLQQSAGAETHGEREGLQNAEESAEETRLTAEERRVINEYFPGAFPEEENDAQPDNTGAFSAESSDIRFRFIGEKGAANLDAAEEATTRLDNLAVAKEMEVAGKDAGVIKKATGWERGADNLWRYETMDFFMKSDWQNAKTLPEAIEDEELFKAYPMLRDTKVLLKLDEITGGVHNVKTNSIEVMGRSLDALHEALVHEVQHAIQEAEGFEAGGNPLVGRAVVMKMWLDKYYDIYQSSTLRKVDYAYRDSMDIIGMLDDIRDLRERKVKADKINDKKETAIVRLEKLQNLLPHPDGKKTFSSRDFGPSRIWDIYDWLDSYGDYLMRLEESSEISKEERRAADIFNLMKDDSGFDAYTRIAGEVEARNAAKRRGMNMRRRMETLATETEDISREDQILINDMLEQFRKMYEGMAGTQESRDVRFRTSMELDEEFGAAWRDQQNEDGRHSTQVSNTKSTYEKIGKYLADEGMKGADILDASSGLGLGTQALREMGFNVDDVEPFPSENREAPTFASYDAIDGKYDVVISNAVLNVIPDDWRADVLHKMAAVVKDGGKIIINTRPASNISKQGVEGKTRITLDSPSEILVKRGDRIAAYQKGFTSEELASWIESELGEGWRVEKATKKNSGISGEGTAVVIKEGEPRFRAGVPTEDVVKEGVNLSPAQTASLAGDIFAALPEDERRKITDSLNGNILKLQDAIMQIPASLAVKEEWNEQDKAVANVIAEQMTKAVDKEMTRPFSASEALWVLYDSTHKSADLVSEASRALVRRNLGFAENQGEIDRVRFSVRDSFETIDEIVNNGKQKVSDANAVSAEELFNRLSAINGDLSKVRRAAAAQKAYDKATVKSVTDLANELLEKGALSDMTRGEIKRLISVIKDAVGREDLSTSVDRLMDIMITNQLRNMRGRFEQILKIRDKRVDQRGVEVKGKLDVNGQRIMAALREGIGLDRARLEERISEAIDKMFESSAVVSKNAENDFAGYKLALAYQEKIQESEQEEKDLRNELKVAKELYDGGGMTREAYREFVKSIYEAIRENRMQRVTDYGNVIGDVTGMIVGSASAASLLKESEKARVEKIHHYANSDMQGMPSVQQGKVDSAFWNNSIIRFLFKPLATFDQMLRSFAPKSRSGEGYLWNHFMGSWLKASENEFKGTQEAHETLDRKVRSIFPGAKRWSDLFSIEKKMPMMDVKFWDGEKMADFKLTQGNLLYIYMVNKMTDGKMKLRKMGITEEDVQRIARELDPRFLELADWVQDAFLPGLRDKYNAVHERLFGAPMAAIDDYFPIRVLANARTREVDLGIAESSAKPSTITGSIIKRTRNSLALDILGSDAFDVVLEHIEQMEKWAAFAEFNQDLNTLLSYNKFRNRVQNMKGIYGAGTTVWNNFRAVAEIAAGVYQSAVKSDSIDKMITNIAKGVTGAKISFRVYTALKQFLSAPAFVSDASPVELAKALANPVGAWDWAMYELPIFEKRWKSRQAGDSRLMETESDWKVWKNKIVELAGRYGMTPNAFVDALTVSIGAKSIYETKLKQYIKDGYSREQAEEKAKRDATVLFNESQQSNEAAFLSAAQVDRTVASILITVFRNSSMGYQRMYVDGLRNIKHMLKKGYKKESIEFMAKQMVRDGLTPEQAERAATRIYNRSFAKNAARVATFGFLVQFAWNLGPYMAYLLMGDDDDEKKDMLIDAAIRGFVGGPIEGLAAGQAISPLMGDIVKGEPIQIPELQLPIASDLEAIFRKLGNDNVSAINDIVNLVIQSSIGVNPQTITDAVVAIVDACDGDMLATKEATLALMRILQTPQSQIEKLYMENIDFTAEEALDMTIKEFAERYAKYKVMRNAPIGKLFGLYSDEKEKELEDKYIKQFIKKAEEMQKTHGSEETKELLEYIDADYDEVTKKIKDFKKEIKKAAEEGESTDEMQKEFENYVEGEEYREYADISWDIEDFKAYRKALKDTEDPELRKEYADSMQAARDRALKRIKAEK